MKNASSGPLRVGVAGPVGSGKTALVDALCKALRDHYDIAVVTNDIYTKEDAQFLIRSGALPEERISVALQRLHVPTTSRLTLPLARQLALSDGIRGVVAGSLRSFGGRYALSLRLVSATSGGSKLELNWIDFPWHSTRSRANYANERVRTSRRFGHSHR